MMSRAAFAATIKGKYPDYANVPDDELVTRIIAKYPDYASQVEDGGDLRSQAQAHLAAIQSHQDIPEEGAGRRFLKGLGIPTSMAEAQAMGDELSPDKHLDVALLGPAPRAAYGLLRTIGSEMGTQAGEAADSASAGNWGAAARHAAGAAIPLVGPPAAEGNLAGAAGRLTNVLAPEVLRLAPAMGRSGVAQYADALAERDSPNRPLAETIGERLGAEGVRMSQPRKQLGGILEKKIAGVDTETPILTREHPAQTAPILDDIRSQREALFNEVKRVPAAEDAELRATQVAKLEKRYPMAEVIEERGDLVVKQIRHPSFWTKANELNKLAEHIRTTGESGTIPNETLRNLTKDYNHVSGVQGSYRVPGIDETYLPADANAAAAIRDQVNTDPASAAANAEKSTLLEAKAKLPREAQRPQRAGMKDLARAVGGGSAAAVAGAIGGPEAAGIAGGIAGAGELLSVFNRIRTNPLWRTTAGSLKIRASRALASGDTAAMSNIAARAIGGAALADPYGHDEAIHDAVTGAMDQANGDEGIARQILSKQGATYVNPDGTEVSVPFHVVRAFIGKLFDVRNSNPPVAQSNGQAGQDQGGRKTGVPVGSGVHSTILHDGKAENDDMITSTPIDKLLPSRFKNAISARGTSPISGVISEFNDRGERVPHPETWGMYGDPLPDDNGVRSSILPETKFPTTREQGSETNPSRLTNDIQISKEAWKEDPIATVLHEYMHAAYFKDLAPGERRQWERYHDRRRDEAAANGANRRVLPESWKSAENYGPAESFAEIAMNFMRDPRHLLTDDPESYKMMYRTFGRDYTQKVAGQR